METIWARYTSDSFGCSVSIQFWDRPERRRLPSSYTRILSGSDTCYLVHKGSLIYPCKEKLCMKISKNCCVPTGAYLLKVPGPPLSHHQEHTLGSQRWLSKPFLFVLILLYLSFWEFHTGIQCIFMKSPLSLPYNFFQTFPHNLVSTLNPFFCSTVHWVQLELPLRTGVLGAIYPSRGEVGGTTPPRKAGTASFSRVNCQQQTAWGGGFVSLPPSR